MTIHLNILQITLHHELVLAGVFLYLCVMWNLQTLSNFRMLQSRPYTQCDKVTFRPYPVSSSISGATYVGVPQTAVNGRHTSTARPKSASFRPRMLASGPTSTYGANFIYLFSLRFHCKSSLYAIPGYGLWLV